MNADKISSENKVSNGILCAVVCSTEDNSFYCNGKFICTYSYDKKQQKYITKHEHKSYERGYKFLYANNPIALATQIQKRINNYK